MHCTCFSEEQANASARFEAFANQCISPDLNFTMTNILLSHLNGLLTKALACKKINFSARFEAFANQCISPDLNFTMTIILLSHLIGLLTKALACKKIYFTLIFELLCLCYLNGLQMKSLNVGRVCVIAC